MEGYPREIAEKQVSSSFLYSATRTLFEQTGFTYERPKGKFNCVMTATIAPSHSTSTA